MFSIGLFDHSKTITESVMIYMNGHISYDYDLNMKQRWLYDLNYLGFSSISICMLEICPVAC